MMRSPTPKSLLFRHFELYDFRIVDGQNDRTKAQIVERLADLGQRLRAPGICAGRLGYGDGFIH